MAQNPLTIPERIATLECVTEKMQKQVDETSEEVNALKDFTAVVEILKNTVEQQSENMVRQGEETNKNIQETNRNIKDLAEIISKMKETTEEMKISQARIETKQQYYLVDGISALFRKIGTKGIVIGLIVIGGIITYLGSFFHLFL